MAVFNPLVLTAVCCFVLFGSAFVSSSDNFDDDRDDYASNAAGDFSSSNAAGDLSSSKTAGDLSSSKAAGDLSSSKTHLGGKGPIEGNPTLKFLYCYSCGYQKAFDHYSSILNEKYPELHIIGTNYDPSMVHLIGAKILSIVKIMIIMAIGSGINFFEHIGYPQPNWWAWCISNKIYACLVVFFGSNMLEGMLISTGAFELYFNDIPVWSKLETGRIPQPSELFQIIDNYLLFDSPYPS